MSKLSNCIKMLILLKNNGKMSIQELSKRLEVKERQIREYKYELEKAGIFIESNRGKYGGYFIPKDTFIPYPNLKNEEYTSLLLGKELLKQDNNFMLLDEYSMAVDKVGAAMKDKEVTDLSYNILNNSRPNINIEKEKDKYLKISESLLSRKKIRITYFSLKAEKSIRIVRPYSLFLYKGFWYLIGYCELRNSIRDFKLSRIKDYEIIDEEYKIPCDFSLTEYTGKSGIFNSKQYDIKLRIYPPMSIIVEERIWASNQSIVQNEDKSIIFTASMGIDPELRSWIMSMGSCAEVLEPEHLREYIKDEIKKMKNLY
ncbi:helix-turn-helix transcriptional regulator [Tepidibacter sp. Z1-5]|uniref:helix-turn-helix transcriptional regulator n=1 Tax=Tepidibacter sp. Z1-5 TaxID=3134138 RepID=UPI0030BFF33E